MRDQIDAIEAATERLKQHLIDTLQHTSKLDHGELIDALGIALAVTTTEIEPPLKNAAEIITAKKRQAALKGKKSG